MEINFEHYGNKIIISYDDYGILKNITESNTGKKLMYEFYQEGDGFEINENNGYLNQKTCTATYVRIIDLDIFIPKFIIIPANIKKYYDK